MRKLGLLIALLFVLVGCAEKPQPAALPIPMSVPAISGVSMLNGDELAVSCDGSATLVGDSPSYTLSCTVPVDTPTTTVVATATEAPSATDEPTATFTDSPTNTPAPTDATTPVPTATATDTGTPTAINTSVPVATFTPTPQLAPVASAPLCPSHNPDLWHGLWDSTRRCHYDHEHGTDPNSSLIVGYPISGTNLVMDSIRALQGGVDNGYIWQTTAENTLKHQGYKGQSAVDMPCEQQNYNYMPASKRDCIRSFSVVFHHDVGVREGLGRFHSATVYAQVCGRDGSWCGDIFTGGLSDTGDLHSKYKTTCQDAPGSNRPPCPSTSVWENQRHNPGYWAYNDLEEANKLFASGDLRFSVDSRNFPSNRIGWSNYSSDRTPAIGNRAGQANLIFHINARDYRESSYYDTVEKKFKYFCPLSDCVATSSAVYIYALALQLPAGLPVGADGFITYSGFTDRAGRLKTSCTTASVECVPFRVRHVKPTPGLFIYDMAPGFTPGVRTHGDGVITNGARYYDVTPAGVKCAFDQSKQCSWIKLP